jgi:hypothetical protein
MASKSTKDVLSYVIRRQALQLCAWGGGMFFCEWIHSHMSVVLYVFIPRRGYYAWGGIGLVGVVGQV